MTACAKETSKPTTSCGVLYKYDKATEEQGAKEYEAMQTASVYPVTREFMDDYRDTRASIRDCGK